MGDKYARFAHTAAGRALVRRFGLPEPPKLRRYQPGDPLVPGPVLFGDAPGGRVSEEVQKLLSTGGVELKLADEPVARPAHPDRPPLHAALVFDATGIADPEELESAYTFLHPHLDTLYPNGRVVLLATPPDATGGGLRATAAQQALEGLLRSLAKELRRGSTAQLVQVAPGAEGGLESTLRFLLSARSAYLSGQVIRIDPAPVGNGGVERPLADQVALVTGAAGGIGAATVEALARDGAQVVCVDLPGAGDALAGVANRVGGSAMQLDLTASTASRQLVEHLEGRYGRLDILVHNAGVTADQTLATMDSQQWHRVLEVNLTSAVRLTEAVLAADLLVDASRILGVSSVNGIAGSHGQTNYAASKAGIVGLMRALAAELRSRQITANAVAPGFIESPLTDQMPRVPREVARRVNTLAQAGEPVDVAETIAWLAAPGSAGISGQVIRVCGQSVMGA